MKRSAISLTRFAVISLHLAAIMSLLLASLPVEAAAPLPPQAKEEQAPELALAVPPDIQPGVAPNDPLPGVDSYPAYALEGWHAGQPQRVEMSAAEEAAALASFDLPAVNEADDVPGYSLALVGRGKARPGDLLLLAFQVEGALDEGLALLVTVPQGFAWAGDAGSFNAETRTLRLGVAERRGLLAWTVAEDAQGPFVFQARLVVARDDRLLAQANLGQDEEGLTLVAQSGGTASGLDERASVSFPANAAAEGLAVRLRRPSARHMPPFALSGLAFEITARGQGSGAEWRQFARPLTITLHYEESQLAGDERFAQLYYYDEQLRDWVALPSRVDTQNNTITALSDHLTVFDVGVSDWQEARLPSLQPYQVAPFTGAAAFSIPLWTPPGPAGLAPSLELSYNSQVSDNLSVNSTQASWVGLGWTLEAGGSIERSMRGLPDSLTDDTYAITAAGVASELAVGLDGAYHTTDESFWRIEYNATADSWTAWDRLGTKYVFGDNEATRARYPYDIGNTCDQPPPGEEGKNPIDTGDVHYGTWRWSLRTVTNIYGQTLTYEYDEDAQTMKLACSHPLQPGIPTDVAVYPLTITYPTTGINPLGDYKVIFVTEERSDYKSQWTQASSARFFETLRLKEVQVLRGTQMIRRYRFTYETNPVLFPAHTWSAGGAALTLRSVQEFGADNSYLPDTTFSYDALHLTQVDNGYGGRVAFEYEAQPWREETAQDNRAHPAPDNPYTTGDDLCYYIGTIYLPPPQQSYDYYGTNVIGYNGGTATCNDSSYRGHLIVNGQAYLANTPGRFLQPGGAYRAQVTIKKITTNPPTAYVGVNSGSQVLIAASGSISSQATLDGYRILPTNATQVNLHIECSRKCEVLAPKLTWLAARYRVTTKKVYDGISATPQVFQYRYDEPATQPLTDLDGMGWQPGDPLPADPTLDYVDFRGHAATLELGPDGRLNTTFFHQDIDFKGRSSLSVASQATFLDTFSTGVLSTTNWVGYNGGTPTVAYLKGDYALKLVGDATTRNADRPAYANGKGFLTQFMLSGASSSGAAGLISDSPSFRRWGVWFKSDLSLVVNYTDDVGYTAVPMPNAEGGGTMTWQRDKWYVLLLIIDDDEPSQVWVWERDNPSVMGRYTHTMPSRSNWRARFGSTNATLWVDAYTEGKFYNLSETRYAVQQWETQTNWPPIKWVNTTQETSYSFEGDASWTGKRAAYAYGGYGNRTRQLEMAWNGSVWTDYRLSVTSYLTNTAAPKYLVGYPWVESVYRCASGSQGGNCLNAALNNANLLQQSRNVYDGVIDAPPAVGVLTAKRTLLRFASANDPRYLDETYVHDTWGNVTQTTIYNSEGTSAALASGDARTSTATYDSSYHTYLLSQTNPLGHTVSFTYDYSLGLPVTMTGPNGPDTTVSVQYDYFGRPLKIIRPGDNDASPTIQFSYSTYGVGNPFHIQLSQKMAEGAYANFVRYYNGLGQVIQAQTVGAVLETGTFNVVTDTAYDAYGQAVQQFVPYTYIPQPGEPYTYTQPLTTPYSTYVLYDPLGRPLAVTDTAGVAAHYVYKDLETRLTDGKGNTTRTLYDIWGRVTQVIPLNGDNNASPAGPAISYVYDDLDRLTTVWQGTAISTTLTYDFAGRKIEMLDPDMGHWMYGYNYLGNLTQQTDARGCITTLGYDLINRLTQKSFSGTGCPTTPTVTYSYDDDLNGNYGKGLRTGMTDAGGSAIWKYDARGQLIKEVRTLTGYGTFRTDWGYNKAGLLTTMWYPADNAGNLGEVVNYTYLPQMAMSGMFAGDAPGNPIYTQSTQYDSAGRVTKRTLGNNAVQTQFTYYAWNVADQGGKLQRIFSQKPGATIHQDLNYAYDKNGNILTIDDYKNGSPFHHQFTYDNLDRLYTADATGGAAKNYDEDYTYNSTTGNLATKAGVTYTYGSAAHKHAVTSLSNGNTYQYDLNGNMTQRYANQQTYNFGYDAENHLTAVSGAAQAQFKYNGDGQRVVATEGVTTTVFVGNYFELQMVNGITTTQTTKYYYAGGTRVAMQRGSQGVKYLLGDHLSSASVVLNADGTQLGAQGYRPWGEVNFTEGTIPTEYTFTGQFSYVSRFGMAYFNARWYLPELGRFSQPDTIIPEQQQGTVAWDRHAGLNNNPVRYSDPTGHVGCDATLMRNHKYGSACQEDQDAPPPRIAGLDNLVCDSTGVPEGVTCEEIIQSYIDVLWMYGGDEGQQIVLDFVEYLQENTVTITFTLVAEGDSLMQTDPNTHQISIRPYFAEEYAERGPEGSLVGLVDGQGNNPVLNQSLHAAAYFGHELFHLLREKPPFDNYGSWLNEYRAYKFQETLYVNMNRSVQSLGLRPNGWIGLNKNWWMCITPILNKFCKK